MLFLGLMMLMMVKGRVVVGGGVFVVLIGMVLGGVVFGLMNMS